MARKKTNKSKGQLLIHDIDKMLLDAIKKIALEEKRSVGKQAEYLLKKQLETHQ